jgi:hypothetical protein
MSINREDFRIVKESITIEEVTINTKDLIECVAKTNQYIQTLADLFQDLNFNLFEILGQRNLSGVIGEIFSRFFCKSFSEFSINPHPDGTPDILNVSNKAARKYLEDQCFDFNGVKSIPIKSKLSPFLFGGIEIKCTIGDPVSNYKKLLLDETGSPNFNLETPRIKYLSGFTYWAHHRNSTRIIGLYYDYYSLRENKPQILAGFFTNLSFNDWNVVSLGKDEGKKTSNTSLTKSGKKKLYEGCAFIIEDNTYIKSLERIGIQTNSTGKDEYSLFPNF